MLISRAEKWYRPYYITASNNKSYELENIHFYKDNEILVSTGCGYLEKQVGNITRDIESLELPIDEIKVKRKESFKGDVYIISKGKNSYSNELLAELYIPSEMLDVQFVENTIMYNYQVRAVYKGTDGIFINTYVKSIDEKLHSIRNQYDELYEACAGYNFSYHTENILENIDKLKALAEQYITEKKRIKSLTINDIDL